MDIRLSSHRWPYESPEKYWFSGGAGGSVTITGGSGTAPSNQRMTGISGPTIPPITAPPTTKTISKPIIPSPGGSFRLIGGVGGGTSKVGGAITIIGGHPTIGSGGSVTISSGQGSTAGISSKDNTYPAESKKEFSSGKLWDGFAPNFHEAKTKLKKELKLKNLNYFSRRNVKVYLFTFDQEEKSKRFWAFPSDDEIESKLSVLEVYLLHGS